MMEDEINSWNSTFSSPLQESDLKRPTEMFMVKTFVAYLQKFGYKVEPPFPLTTGESENTPQKRAFMIRLAQNIDRILKYCSETYSCVYIDLVLPLPKKTSKMLSVLLNYYLYYVMFKKDVFDMAHEPLKKRGEIIRAIDEMRRSNEDRRQTALQLKDGITKLSVALPTAQAEKEDYCSKIKQLEEKFANIKPEVEELQEKLLGLQTQGLFLQKQIVQDKEGEHLKSELETLEENIKQHNLLKLNMQSSLNERTKLINRLEKQLKYVENAKALLPAELLLEYNGIVEQLKQKKSEHENIMHDVELLKNTITKLNVDLETEIEKSNSKKRNHQQEISDRQAMITEKQKLCFEKKEKLKSLISELETIKNLEQEQIEIRDFIMESAAKLMN